MRPTEKRHHETASANSASGEARLSIHKNFAIRRSTELLSAVYRPMKIGNCKQRQAAGQRVVVVLAEQLHLGLASSSLLSLCFCLDLFDLRLQLFHPLHVVGLMPRNREHAQPDRTVSRMIATP